MHNHIVVLISADAEWTEPYGKSYRATQYIHHHLGSGLFIKTKVFQN